MKTLAKLLWVEVKLFAREPIAVVFAFAFPLVVLLVLAGVFGSEPDANFGGVAGIDYYVPGYLAVVIASVGLIGLPVHLASLRERGVLRRLRASSVSMASVFAAQTVVHVAMAALGGVLLLAAASLVYEVHAPSSVAGVALGFAVGALGFVALGLLLGSLAPTARAAQAVGLVLFFPMWLLSGAGPPRGVMTEAMRQLSDILPLTRVVTAIQEPWLGTGSNLPELVALSALFSAAVALTAWANAESPSGLRPSSGRHQPRCKGHGHEITHCRYRRRIGPGRWRGGTPPGGCVPGAVPTAVPDRRGHRPASQSLGRQRRRPATRGGRLGRRLADRPLDACRCQLDWHGRGARPPHLIPSSGRLSVTASIASSLGVAAAGLVAGIVLMEAALVAPAAKACAASSACLSPGNQPFLSEFADASWNDVAHLSYAAGTLIFALGTLAVLGWMAKTMRPWEALVMVIGVVGIYATNTALHGDAKYGLAFLLVASASIALRIGRSSRHG